MKMFIKAPYPGENEGPWVECTTYYMRKLWERHKKQGKKVLKQMDYPDDCISNGRIVK